MSAIKVNFEIGHKASLKSKKTPEGFTHDWEVFVRGQEGADISHFVDKVVFHLHETFPKPRRVVKEPPFSINNTKKYKTKEFKEEVPPKTSSFENLFGPPIQKPPKVSPDPKKVEKNIPTVKLEKKSKDRSSSDKKSKHEHKEPKSEKIKVKNEKEKTRFEKVKNHKETERSKDKPSKRPNERPPSPEIVKKRCVSPVRRPPSPSQRSNSASSIKEEYKSKHIAEIFESKKPKNEIESRPVEIKVEKEGKEKKKKEKKSHDRDKERKEKKEHKKESHKLKESPKEQLKELTKESPKVKEVIKEKEPIKDLSHTRDKPPKSEKAINKFSIENLRKTPPPDGEENVEGRKIKEKGDSERKHKHKKKDKKRDESKEKHKESNKEKKNKHEKVKEPPPEKPEIIEHRETPGLKEHLIPEPASPISIDTASQCSSKSGQVKNSHISIEDVNSSHSDSEVSIIADDDDVKEKIENPSPVIKHEPSPEPEPEPEPEIEPEVEPIVEAPPVQQKEKSKKHKDRSSKREEKRRKRKAAEEEEIESRKIVKANELGTANNETGESSGSVSAETKVQDNGVSSSLGEDAEPGDLSPDYMVQLRGLQQRIMMIKNNEDLERVVNLIAETGRYEVTTQTFDFDLCLLDRSTVQRLIQLVGC
ncbi:unnamed protein product, partial [Iphiclides podalirius]